MQLNTKQILPILSRALFAGICIGIAGWGFLANKTVGMFLFIFGLATVVSYRAKLYTGMAGFVASWQDVWELLLLVLPGNILGCALVAWMTTFSPLPLHDAAHAVLQSRLSVGPLGCGVLAIGCGILMTTAVTFAKKSNDFGHYYLTGADFICANPSVLACYATSVLGNFIGCNIPRTFVREHTV